MKLVGGPTVGFQNKKLKKTPYFCQKQEEGWEDNGTPRGARLTHTGGGGGGGGGGSVCKSNTSGSRALRHSLTCGTALLCLSGGFVRSAEADVSVQLTPRVYNFVDAERSCRRRITSQLNGFLTDLGTQVARMINADFLPSSLKSFNHRVAVGRAKMRGASFQAWKTARCHRPHGGD